MNGHVASLLAPVVRDSRWTKWFLIASCALAVIALDADVGQIDLLARAGAWSGSGTELESLDAIVEMIGILRLVALAGTAACFLAWFQGAYKNLTALGNQGTRYRPGWSVGGFFVPLLNLVRPMQIMRETWHKSDPAYLGRDLDSEPEGRLLLKTTPSLVGWWWIFFVGSAIAGNIAIRAATRHPEPTISDLQSMLGFLALSDGLAIPGAVVTILLVGRITRYQQARGLRLQDAAAEPPPASEAASPGAPSDTA